jgi:hypothetical protein
MEEASEPRIADYLNKMILLEDRLGQKVGYKPLEPFCVPGTQLGDFLELQAAAKKIAEFVGLGNFTFVISKAKQKEKVAGQIELNYSGNDVFVEISSELIKFEDAVVATLAHEITHKYMQIHCVTASPGLANEYDNEVLTDITAVFLGLGKLMLNGAEEEKAHEEERFDGTHHITETQRCGYLSLQQLAFVYRLVCAMRGISNREVLSNLSQQAESAVLWCETNYGHYFRKEYGADKFTNNILNRTTEKTQKAVKELDSAEELLRLIQEICVDKAEIPLQANRDRILAMQNELRPFKPEDIYDPALRYLKSIQLKERSEQILSEIHTLSLATSKTSNNLKKVWKKVKKLKFQ